MGGKRGTPEERFWPKVTTGDGCWGWTSAKSPNGYGMFSITGTKSVQAHRFSWELHNGEIPEGVEVGHRCHDEDESCNRGTECPHRQCTNPAHLYLQTHKENLRAGRKGRKGGGYKKEWTHCTRGHEFTKENTIWYKGKRSCRTCVNIHQMERYYARKS